MDWPTDQEKPGQTFTRSRGDFPAVDQLYRHIDDRKTAAYCQQIGNV